MKIMRLTVWHTRCNDMRWNAAKLSATGKDVYGEQRKIMRFAFYFAMDFVQKTNTQEYAAHIFFSVEHVPSDEEECPKADIQQSHGHGDMSLWWSASTSVCTIAILKQASNLLLVISSCSRPNQWFFLKNETGTFREINPDEPFFCKSYWKRQLICKSFPLLF